MDRTVCVSAVMLEKLDLICCVGVCYVLERCDETERDPESSERGSAPQSAAFFFSCSAGLLLNRKLTQIK